MESVTVFTDSFFDESSERFFFFPVLKSVSYQPDPFNLNDGAPSFRLKGSGWYETDFKTGKKKNLSDDSSKKESVNTVTDSKKADKKDKIS